MMASFNKDSWVRCATGTGMFTSFFFLRYSLLPEVSHGPVRSPTPYGEVHATPSVALHNENTILPSPWVSKNPQSRALET